MNGHTDAIAHGIEPEDDLEEFAYLEEMYQRRREEVNKHYQVGVSIGRMQRLTDEMTEIANKFAPKATVRRYMADDIECPF